MELYHLSNLPIMEIVRRLVDGSVMIYPTETVAGIGCIGSDREAVERVYTIKQRSLDKPVSYAFASRSMVERFVNIPEWIDPLFGLLPGPLTIVLPRLDTTEPLYGVEDDTVGVRIPAMPWLLNLIEKVGEPIISTSANISGTTPAYAVADLPVSLQSAVDIIISWEDKLRGTPSTVIGLDTENKDIEIYRQGAISQLQLYNLL